MKRVLSAMNSAGLLQKPYTAFPRDNHKLDVTRPETSLIVRKVGAESVLLLRNKVLPLNAQDDGYLLVVGDKGHKHVLDVGKVWWVLGWLVQ